MKILCCILLCLSAVLAKRKPPPDQQNNEQNQQATTANKVIRAHLGDFTKTQPFRGQLSTIRDSRSLSCDFNLLELCCWYNTPSPIDDLDWVVVNSTVDKPRFQSRYGGSNIRIPTQPFAVVTAASQASSERGMLVSCAIPCQAGAGQLTLDHWLDTVELNVCRMRVAGNTVVEPCANVKGTGRSTVLVDSLPDPFYVAIIATGFGPNGLAVIDNLRYSARIPMNCNQ